MIRTFFLAIHPFWQNNVSFCLFLVSNMHHNSNAPPAALSFIWHETYMGLNPIIEFNNVMCMWAFHLAEYDDVPLHAGHFCQTSASLPSLFCGRAFFDINMKTLIGCWDLFILLFYRRLIHLKIRTCIWSGRRWWHWMLTRRELSLFGTSFFFHFPCVPKHESIGLLKQQLR